MSLLDFARGPAIDAALAIFCLGLLWRLTSLLLLPRAKDNSVPKAGAPGAVPAAFRGFMRHMWVPEPYRRAALFSAVNGWVFHLGLAIVVFGFAQHILFIKGLTGLSWPGLPTGVVSTVAVITLASLLAAMTRRLTNPVLKLISTTGDYFAWLVTVLPVITGLMAINHLLLPYETMLALHILSVAALLIWFPFGKLMHAVLVFFTRSKTSIFHARRGVEI
jgi:nitrate reductase gamma subunit